MIVVHERGLLVPADYILYTLVPFTTYLLEKSQHGLNPRLELLVENVLLLQISEWEHY